MNFLIKKYLLVLIAFFFIVFSARANSESSSTKVTRKGNIVFVQIGPDQYQVEVCTPSMIRIRQAMTHLQPRWGYYRSWPIRSGSLPIS